MSTGKSASEHPHRAIIRSAGIIGLATFVSRILGFFRDVVIAHLFGVYLYAQAFVIAFRIPNLLRDLVGEGAANAAFVPVFSEYNLKHSKKEFWELANVVLNLMLVILAAITILGIFFSPLIVRLIAPGFIADPEKLAATIKLNRIIFPYILLIGLAAYATGVLNSLKHFTIPAFAPCLLNISIIVFAMLFGEGIKGLATGVLAGGFLQLAVQIPVLYKKGFRFNLSRRFRHPAAKTIGLLMVPRLFGSCIYQLNNFVDSIFGSFAFIVGEGGVAVLYFAYRLIQFPLGVFSTALSQAMLPTFSTQALEDGHARLAETLSFGMRAVFFIMLPVSVAFMVLSKQLVLTLFGGGKFDNYSAQMTSQALFFYSIGLAAYGATKILQSCFFALKDTVTPAKVSFLALCLNIILNILLIFPMKLKGLALATSLSGIISFLVLFFILGRRLKIIDFEGLAYSFLRILLASIFMGAACYLVSINSVFSGANLLERAVNLGLAILTGAAAYLIFCLIFKVGEMQELWQWLRKKKKS
jgi:putative peptidoglycan lipid II flippase